MKNIIMKNMENGWVAKDIDYDKYTKFIPMFRNSDSNLYVMPDYLLNPDLDDDMEKLSGLSIYGFVKNGITAWTESGYSLDRRVTDVLGSKKMGHGIVNSYMLTTTNSKKSRVDIDVTDCHSRFLLEAIYTLVLSSELTEKQKNCISSKVYSEVDTIVEFDTEFMTSVLKKTYIIATNMVSKLTDYIDKSMVPNYYTSKYSIPIVQNAPMVNYYGPTINDLLQSCKTASGLNEDRSIFDNVVLVLDSSVFYPDKSLRIKYSLYTKNKFTQGVMEVVVGRDLEITELKTDLDTLILTYKEKVSALISTAATKNIPLKNMFMNGEDTFTLSKFDIKSLSRNVAMVKNYMDEEVSKYEESAYFMYNNEKMISKTPLNFSIQNHTSNGIAKVKRSIPQYSKIYDNKLRNKLNQWSYTPEKTDLFITVYTPPYSGDESQNTVSKYIFNKFVDDVHNYNKHVNVNRVSYAQNVLTVYDKNFVKDGVVTEFCLDKSYTVSCIGKHTSENSDDVYILYRMLEDNQEIVESASYKFKYNDVIKDNHVFIKSLDKHIDALRDLVKDIKEGMDDARKATLNMQYPGLLANLTNLINNIKDNKINISDVDLVNLIIKLAYKLYENIGKDMFRWPLNVGRKVNPQSDAYPLVVLFGLKSPEKVVVDIDVSSQTHPITEQSLIDIEDKISGETLLNIRVYLGNGGSMPSSQILKRESTFVEANLGNHSTLQKNVHTYYSLPLLYTKHVNNFTLLSDSAICRKDAAIIAFRPENLNRSDFFTYRTLKSINQMDLIINAIKLLSNVGAEFIENLNANICNDIYMYFMTDTDRALASIINEKENGGIELVTYKFGSVLNSRFIAMIVDSNLIPTNINSDCSGADLMIPKEAEENIRMFVRDVDRVQTPIYHLSEPDRNVSLFVTE